MSRAVILSAVRTPVGRYGGVLAGVRPDDLAATAISAAVDRSGAPVDAIEDVYFGCANQAGEDNRNVARMAALLAGLLIHEGQLTFGAEGLHKSLDLGEWWLLETGLPLPLGVNVARRDLGRATLHELSEVLRESIQVGLANRRRALAYAMQYGRGLDEELADRFVGMYVNDLTCDYGEEGRQAVQELLARAEAIGAYEQPVRVEFVA